MEEQELLEQQKRVRQQDRLLLCFVADRQPPYLPQGHSGVKRVVPVLREHCGRC